MAPPAPGGPAPLPPPGMAPPPPGAAPPGAPPGESPAVAMARAEIDPSTRYGALGTLKVMAVIFMIICLILNFVFLIYDPGTQQMVPEQLGTIGGIAAIVLSIIGVVFGFMAVYVKLRQKVGPYPLQTFMMLLSPLFLLIGAGVKPTIMNVGPVDPMDLILALIFGVFFILYIEYLHAVFRFNAIGKMAIERNLKDFDFGHVIRHYMGFGGGVLGIIIALSLVVVFLRDMFLTMMASTPQVTNSVEMNSVYGLAISSSIIFTILGIVLSFWFGSRDYAASIRAVSSFSKERMRQMSDESKARSGPAPAGAVLVEVPKR